jgi:hypothetical protein
MQRKPADVIADSNVIGPAAVFVVDGNNNLVNPAGASDVAISGNLTSASGAGSTVQLQLGDGQATWEAQLTGTFSGGTTIAFRGSDDASSPTNWQSAVGYNSALTNPVFITQIGGPGSFIIRGPASGYQFIQMVCTALHSEDNVTVRLIGSTGAMAGGGPVNIPDGSNVVEGLTTDAAVLGDVSGTFSAKLRGLSKILNDIWDNANHRIASTNPSIGADGSAIPASSTLIGASDGTNLQQLLVESASNRNLRAAIYNATNELGIDAGGRLTVILQAVAGTALTADQSNSELRVSNYVKTTTAGDTALTLGNTTMVNSLPITNASDQTPLVTSTATRSNVAAAASDTSLLASNASRKGAIFFNDSTAVLYLAYGAGAASISSYSVQIPANGFFELPPAPIYTGAIRGIWSAANGNVRITELS